MAEETELARKFVKKRQRDESTMRGRSGNLKML